MRTTGGLLGRVFRGVALFFVAFALVDMTAPEVCAEELLGLPPLELLEASRGARDAGDAPSPDRHDGSEAPDEDCFCCCSHLLVYRHFVLETEPVERATLEPLPLALPTGLDPPLYHPPRAA